MERESKNPLKIVIQHWVEFPEEMEFRCFAFNGKITAINQLCWSSYIEYLDKYPAFQQQILDAIMALHEVVKEHLPWQNYIMDVIYHKDKDCAQICEFNPWGPYSCTGSQLFSWELDSAVILRDMQGDDSPVFRVLRPYMQVQEQFVLRLQKNTLLAISSKFWQSMERSVQRCPCCKRKSDPTDFSLPPTTLFYPSSK